MDISRVSSFLYAVVLVNVCAVGCAAETEEGEISGFEAFAVSSGGNTTPPPPTTWKCAPDPQPNPGDTRGCYVGCWSTSGDSGGSCNIVITASIKNPQPAGCGNYNGNPNPTTQGFLDLGVRPLTPGCAVTIHPRGGDTTVHCNTCPSSLVLVTDGRIVQMPL